MDRLDFALLAELFRSPRKSYEAMGEAIGLSPNAVKARLKRLEEQGVLQGFAATPAPHLLGFREGILAFTGVEDLEEREEEILRALPDVPGVRFVDVTMDHAVVLWVYVRDDADWERLERAAISLVGKPPALRLALPEPASDRQLTPAELRIAQALAPNGRMSLKELVRRSEVSFKTAKRHLERLLKTGALRIEPVLSTSEASGSVLYSLLVVLREEATPRDLLPLLPESTIVTAAPGSRFVVFHVQRRTLREAQQDHRAVKASPAVERVLFEIATRRRADGWIGEALAARLARRTQTPAPEERQPVPVAPPRRP